MENTKNHLKFVSSQGAQVIPLKTKTGYKGKSAQTKEDCFDLDFFDLMLQSEIVLEGSLRMVTAPRDEKNGLYNAINKLGQKASFTLFNAFLDVELNELITAIINKEKDPTEEDISIFVDRTAAKILQKMVDYANG